MRSLYHGSHFQQTSALAAREFGSWSLLSCVVQINARLFIHDRAAFNVACWAFILTSLHFIWERIVEGTVRSRSLVAAEGLAFVSFCWMMVGREGYVGYDRGDTQPSYPWGE